MENLKIEDLELINGISDKSNPKLELNGVLVDATDNAIIATDTRRLIKFNVPSLDIESSIIINKKSIIAILNGGGKKNHTIKFRNLNGGVLAEVTPTLPKDRDYFGVMLGGIVGQYPIYKNILPKTYNNVYVCKSIDMLAFTIVDKAKALIDQKILKEVEKWDKSKNRDGHYEIRTNPDSAVICISFVVASEIIWDYLVMPTIQS